jgi:hypothetical protein
LRWNVGSRHLRISRMPFGKDSALSQKISVWQHIDRNPIVLAWHPEAGGGVDG